MQGQTGWENLKETDWFNNTGNEIGITPIKVKLRNNFHVYSNHFALVICFQFKTDSAH